MIKGMQEVIDVMTKAKADLDKNGGLKQVIFVACGGSFASSYPARFLLNQESSLRVQGYNSSEFVNATQKNVDKNTLVIGILRISCQNSHLTHSFDRLSWFQRQISDLRPIQRTKKSNIRRTASCKPEI